MSEGYAKTAGIAAAWLALTMIVIKLLGAGSLFVLGFLLDRADFGVYAIALASAALVRAFQSGGVQHILVRSGEEEYARLAPQCLWISVALNMAIAAILVGVAPSIAMANDEPQLKQMMYVIASTVLISAARPVMYAKILIDLRYSLQARLNIWMSFIQYAGMIVLAVLGFGPLSFVLPLLAVAAIETVVLLRVVGLPSGRKLPSLALWPPILVQSQWLLLAAAADALHTHGDKMFIGTIVNTETVGVYAFAYMIAFQALALLSMRLREMLFPILSKFKEDIARQASAVTRTLSALMMITAPAMIGISITFPALEQALYDGKWAGAVIATQILCAIIPLRSLITLINSWNMAMGAFKTQFLVLLACGVTTVAGSLAGAFIGGTATSIAIGVGAANLAMFPTMMIAQLRNRGVSWAKVFGAFKPYLLAVGLGAPAWIGLPHLFAALQIQSGRVLPLLVACVVAGVYGLVYAGIIRVMLPDQLRDTLSIVPGGLGEKAVKALRLELPTRTDPTP